MDSDGGTDRRTLLRAVGTAVGSAAVLSTGAAGRATDAVERARAQSRVTVAHADAYDQLDPHRTSDPAERDVAFAAYERLVAHDADGRLVGELATDFEVQPQELSFELRDGVRFHSGAELTPEDAAYSLRRVSSQDVGPEQAYDSRLSAVDNVDATADGVRLTLSRSQGGLIAQVAVSGWIMRREWDQRRTDQGQYREIEGTGPLALADYRETRVELERFEDHWGSVRPPETAEFQQLREPDTRLQAFEAGAVDVAANLPVSTAARVSDGNLATATAPSVPFVPMQAATPPFDDVRFRRAMNHAIDREAVIDAVLEGFGEPLGQPVPATFVGHDDGVDPYPYDPARAEGLVADSGADGAEIELHVPQDFGENTEAVGRAIANQIDALSNVNCSVRMREFGSLINEIFQTGPSDGPSFYVLAWTEPSLDLAPVVRFLLASDAPFTEFEDDRTDQLLGRAETTTGDERAGHLRELSRRVHDQAPWLFAWSTQQRHAIPEDLPHRLRPDGVIDVPALGRTPPSLRVVDVDVPPEVVAGDPVEVRVAVANEGDAAGDAELAVLVGDEGEATRITVAPGETETATNTVSTAAADADESLPVRVQLDGETRASTSVQVVAPRTTAPPTTAPPTTAPPTEPTTGGGTTADGDTAAPGGTTGTAATADGDGGDASGGDGGDGGGGTDGDDVEFGDGSGSPGFGVLAGAAGLLGAAGLRRWRDDDEA
jgi:peptide/nickel transport system substrate-binding protein